MSSDEELPDIPYCPLPEKRIRSDGEEAFLQLQKAYHDLLNIPAKQRSEEEKKEVIRLKNRYCNSHIHIQNLMLCISGTLARRLSSLAW